MATSPAKSGLGKGLGALIGSRPAPRPDPESGERINQVDLANITPSPLQPRKEFAPDALQELVDSIRQHGIIQPLIVRYIDGRHELIAGERRWRAAQEVGLTQVPVIVRTASNLEVLELSLIENLQRTDLNPIEEAHGYARLAGEFGLRQLTQDLLSVGHAKVLLALKALEEQLFVAEAVLRRSATVRGTERLVARQLGIGRVRRRPRAGGASVSSAAIEDLQNRLQQHLGTHVTLHHGEKRGRIEIEYYGDEDLQRIVAALGLRTSET